MKLKTFWMSICALVLALLVVVAFFRGPNSQWLMIGAFGLWAAYTAVMLIRSLLSGDCHTLGAFLVKVTPGWKNRQADAPQLIVENRDLKIAFMNQIILRITENLQYCYPDAVWKWGEKNPMERILNQESCRITISKVKDFNFADIQIDAKGGLNFEFGKKVTLCEIKQNAKEEKSYGGDTRATDDWFYSEGSKVLNNLICELNAAGYAKFFISETGEISIVDEGKPQVLDTDFQMPAISLEKLKDLLKTIHLKTEIDDNKLAVSV